MPLPVNSYGQPALVAAPWSNWSTINLGALASWTFYPLSITAKFAQVIVSNPALTPGQDLYYVESLQGVSTPTTNGNALAPSTFTNPALPGAVGEGLWIKAAVTAQVAGAVQVKQ